MFCLFTNQPVSRKCIKETKTCIETEEEWQTLFKLENLKQDPSETRLQNWAPGELNLADVKIGSLQAKVTTVEFVKSNIFV